MELINEFEVDAPLDVVWSVLTDVERIAPCLPGAQLQEVEGDEYRGVVKVKVGPITAQYKGAASFVEKDDAGYRAVLRAEGRDTRGTGNAAADITAEMAPTATGTLVTVTTDLKVTGKVAQFGRGVMADVSKKLMGQFADNLSELLDQVQPDSEPAVDGPASAEVSLPGQAEEQVRVIDAPEAAAVDLLGAAGTPVLKRLLPVAVAVVVLVVVIIVLA
ncbi:MAG: carbon monoxide dehydrogenase [Acidimicrobiaceae bacterium]|nr:carbon monoxide dehydrogenase [Acidimicrobiaceae bacterium]MED5584537.1 SRPBCC family protein [Actinomycetota bacterium]